MDEDGHSDRIERHEDLRIPVDGDTVAATRFEPLDVEGSAPAVLMYVPYHKDDVITYGAYDPFNRYLAANGYEVVVADMVGTGASSGAVDEMFLRREGEEGAAIVEWLADQEWTNGRVGMYGKSYGGITALDAAAQQPDGLEAIVPIHTPYQGYRNAYTNGGLTELVTIFMTWLGSVQALEVKPPSRRDGDGSWASVWNDRLETVRERTPWLLQFREHPHKDDYWADKDIPVGDVEVPTLAVGGWRDSYTADTVEYYRAIDAPKRLLLGPWRHTMPHRGRESAVDFRRQAADWFDHFLKDADNGVTDGREVVYWTEQDGGGTVEAGAWRRRDAWPASGDGPGAAPDEETVLALSPDGLVAPADYEAGVVERAYEYDHTVGLESTNPYGAEVPPQDTNGDDARSVCFETDPLDEPLELTGTGAARIRLVPTTADMTLSVRVVDVAPDGSARLVTEGTVRGALREGLDAPAELQPGEEHEIAVALKPKSHLYEAGHRVRVAVAAAYFPETAPLNEHGSFTLRSSPAAPSVVRFPGGTHAGGAFADEIEMAAPDTSVPLETGNVVDSSVEWETTRERTTDTARVRQESETELDLPHVDVVRSNTVTASVQADDPSTFSTHNTHRITLEYPSESVEVVASNRFTHDFAQVTSRVTIDDERVFEETWTR